jgi:hypothetical protein
MTYLCPCCGAKRLPEKYLCWDCWWSLPVITRINLNKKDTKSAARLRKLLLLLDKEIPVQIIRISS